MINSMMKMLFLLRSFLRIFVSRGGLAVGVPFDRKPRAETPPLSVATALAVAVALSSLLVVPRALAQTGPAAVPASISGYNIALQFNFPEHGLEATAKVTFTVPQTVESATFALNENLKVEGITDATGATLGAERNGQRITVSFPQPLPPNVAQTITFKYAGILSGVELSPITGIRTAYVGPEGSFLLYPALWFPVSGYGTGRFTMTVSAALPAPYGLLASGKPTATGRAGAIVYTYTESQPTFPGSVYVTPNRPNTLTSGGLTENFYWDPKTSAALVQQYSDGAGREFDFLAQKFGTPPTRTLHIVELPSDSLPSFSSPDMIFLSAASIGTSLNYKLLMDELAQQWFGIEVAPATLNDAWLQYGAARWCEALYVQSVAGKAAFENEVRDLTVGALSYPDTALGNAASLDPFSPQFQDLVYDKGAILFHMLRWVMGDAKLFPAMQAFVAQNAWKSVTTQQFEDALEKSSGMDLRSFFSEWYHGTGAPQFSNEYVIYRLQSPNVPYAGTELPVAESSQKKQKKGKQSPNSPVAMKPLPTGGFRITGRIKQSFDLFNMPVELQIETDGATEDKVVQVSGTDSSYSVDVAGRPRKVVIDPNDWLLKVTPDTEVRVAIARGDNLVAAGDFNGALREYNNALKINPISSLANYRIAEAHFQQQDWQAAANAYREALNGDQIPAWVTVWSHIQLGKIFDLTGQRDRAVNEYQLALQTHDDTAGALEYARQYLKTPFKNA
jgi:tetratricopeptide (TPR) repeat protein